VITHPAAALIGLKSLVEATAQATLG
jgi:hypothetical protein